jgi:hypothetical protein
MPARQVCRETGLFLKELLCPGSEARGCRWFLGKILIYP